MLRIVIGMGGRGIHRMDRMIRMKRMV